MSGDSAKQKIEKQLWEGKTPALSRRNVKVFRFIASSSLHADNSIYYNKRKRKKKKTSFFGVPFGYHSCHDVIHIFSIQPYIIQLFKTTPKSISYLCNIDIVLQMITSLAHKIHKLPSITVARVIFPSIGTNRFLFTHNVRTVSSLTTIQHVNDEVESFGRHGVNFSRAFTFFFCFFTWTKLWEPPEGTIYKLTEEKPLRPSPTESGGWGSATETAPADHFPPPFLNVNRFQTFSFPDWLTVVGWDADWRVHTCVGFSWVRRAGYCEVSISFSLDTQQTCNEITTKSRIPIIQSRSNPCLYQNSPLRSNKNFNPQIW